MAAAPPPTNSGHDGPDAPAPNDLDRSTFGKRLHAARKAFGWTLQQTADASGISLTTISRAERGQLALSYEKFSALAHVLQLDLAALFAEVGARRQPHRLEGPIVTRAGEGVAYRNQAFTYRFLGTQASGKQMSPILGTIHARRINGPEDFASHPGEEFVYVLRGSLEVHFATGEVVKLAKGDTLYFDSRIPHAYKTTSKQLAMTLGACTSESSLMKQARQQRPEPATGPTPARPGRLKAGSARAR